MSGMPKQIVWMAAATLAGVAVLGLYLGFSRNTPPGGDIEFAPVSTAAVPAAKAISAADLARGGPLDEASVRRIAREEAQATLAARSAPKVTANTTAAAEAPGKAAISAATRVEPAPPPPPAPKAAPDADLF